LKTRLQEKQMLQTTLQLLVVDDDFDDAGPLQSALPTAETRPEAELVDGPAEAMGQTGGSQPDASFAVLAFPDRRLLDRSRKEFRKANAQRRRSAARSSQEFLLRFPIMKNFLVLCTALSLATAVCSGCDSKAKTEHKEKETVSSAEGSTTTTDTHTVESKGDNPPANSSGEKAK
jgi:hypothetical protein